MAISKVMLAFNDDGKPSQKRPSPKRKPVPRVRVPGLKFLRLSPRNTPQR